MKNQRSAKAMYLTLGFCMLIAGCNPNSSGSKDTEQRDRDNDPTQVENTVAQDTLSPGVLNRPGRENGLVVVNDFEESDWQRIQQDLDLQFVDDSISSSYGSRNVGADAWKSWDTYEYRLIYYTEDGSLKAKPQLRSRQGQNDGVAVQSLDAGATEELWKEIEKNTSAITDRYRR